MGIFFCFLPLAAAILIFSLCFKLNFSHQIIAVFLGLAAVIPISFVEFFLPDVPFLTKYPLWHAIFKSIVIYGFIEELIKMLLLFALPNKKRNNLEFLFLAFTAGLALGCFESVAYFLAHLQNANLKGAELLYGRIFLRIFTTDVIHFACAGLSGLFVCSIRQKTTKISIFATAVLLHGLYDFFAGFSNFFRIFSFIVVILALAECRVKYKAQDNQNPDF